jgi:hypothetical protein
MTFPTSVNGVQAPAIAGDFCDANEHVSVDAGPGAFVAGPAGVAVGTFAWADATQTYLSNTGAGAPTGFIGRHQQALITAYLGETSNVVPYGFGVTAYSQGGFWVKNSGSGAVTVGMKAYANNATGLVTFAATATPPTSASVTASIAANVFTAAIAANTATASISGTTMTVSAVGAGSVLAATQSVTGVNVAAGTVIVQQLTGTAGSTGTYQVSINQTAASGAVTMSGGGMTVSAITSGTVAAGQTLTAGTNVVVGTAILAGGTGTGGTGTYPVSNGTVVASTAITASGGTMTVSAVGSGTIFLNDTLSGANVTAGTVVTQSLTGVGGTGTYLVSISQTAASAAVTVQAGTETKWVALSAGAAGELVKVSTYTLG